MIQHPLPTFRMPPPHTRRAPGPSSVFSARVLTDYRKDPLSGLAANWRTYGDVVRIPIGLRHVHLLAHPSHVQHVLQTHAKNYSKQTPAFHVLRRVLGDGLFTAEGEVWRKHRRLAQPAFHKRRLSSFARIMAEASEEAASSWLAKPDGSSVLVAHEMMRLTLRIVGLTLLGTDLDRDAPDVGAAVDRLMQRSLRVMQLPVQPPPWLPTPGNLRIARDRELLDRVVGRMIEQRRSDADAFDDLLAMLLEARDPETGEGLSPEELRDEVLTIFLAGHETTAAALSWSFMLLSRHPRVALRLREEVAGVLGGRTPTFDDLPRLTYARAVFQETMRLYPPAWVFPRWAESEDVIDGFHIPEKSAVLLSPYLTHRHPDFWVNPEGFDPERFLGDKSPERNTYFPFGGGARMCIGNHFALMEGTIVLSALAQRVLLELDPASEPRPRAAVTLRPADGLPMRLRAPTTARVAA